LRSESDVRDKRAAAVAAAHRIAAGMSASIKMNPPAAVKTLQGWADVNADYFAGVIAVFDWRLAEGTSPMHRYTEFSEALYFDEYRAVRRILEDGEPPPLHLSLVGVRGIMRGLAWVRSSSDRFVVDPCVYA
jgi:hypothetical protein